MRQKMSQGARKELLAALKPEYLRASWTQKQQLLDGFIAATGYDRKYAIAILNREETPRSQKRQRQPFYGSDIRDALIEIWNRAGNRLCSKRLVPILPTLVEKMEQFGHLQFSQEQRTKLLSLSAATIDRLLKPERTAQRRGRSTTKPGLLLRKQIPVKTFADWNDASPGFVEADLVAHCGDNTRGQFLNTLTVTDVATTWTETAALLRKSEADVLHALSQICASLPFTIRGLDTDNGGEFMNHSLATWCDDNGVTFTRAREYEKNDQAYVEQKNGSIVRRLIGYDRYEGVESWELLSTLYRISRLYVNYFQPSLKLLSKSRDGARVYRRYEIAQTPFERVVKSPSIPEDTKERLRREFDQLDPVLLLNEIERMQHEFWRTAVFPKEVDMPIPSDLPELPATNRLTQTLPQPRRKRADKPAISTANNVRKKPGPKSMIDEVWPEICEELNKNPTLTSRAIMRMLCNRYPDNFRMTQRTSVVTRLSQWRHAQLQAKSLPDVSVEGAIATSQPHVERLLQRDLEDGCSSTLDVLDNANLTRI